jgi:hypothetical protein
MESSLQVPRSFIHGSRQPPKKSGTFDGMQTRPGWQPKSAPRKSLPEAILRAMGWFILEQYEEICFHRDRHRITLN